MATCWEELTHWKRSWCWEILKAGGEGGDRVWDDWMTSLTQWTWVWANARRWWKMEAWHATIQGVKKSWIQLNDWTVCLTNVDWFSKIWHTCVINNYLLYKFTFTKSEFTSYPTYDTVSKCKKAEYNILCTTSFQLCQI